ncbi:MAG: undecaprenyl-diphosphate phosphatase [Actinomycetota bacterium]
MTLFQAFTLGGVQGFTEFLPISSSAHLVLVPTLLGWRRPSLAFDVLLHVASLMAVLVYFRAELGQILMGLRRAGPGRRLLGLLVVATIPAALTGLLLGKPLERTFDRPRAVALELMATGLILLVAEVFARRRQAGGKEKEDSTTEGLAGVVKAGSALVIGAAQAVAILPGISRSGVTIVAGLGTGLSRSQAARFSFLMAIPALAGAAVLKLPELPRLDLGPGPLVVGFLASLISSYLAIGGMIGYLQRRGLHPFAIYCLVAGPIALYLLMR